MFADLDINQAAIPHLPQTIERFPEGVEIMISSVRGERQLCKRMESMGLSMGKQVKVLKNRGQGVLLKTENTRLALRLSSAFVLEAVYPPA